MANLFVLNHGVMYQFDEHPTVDVSNYDVNTRPNLIWMPGSRGFAAQINLPAHLGDHIKSYENPQQEFLDRFIDTPIFKAAQNGDPLAQAKLASQIATLSGVTIQLLATNKLQLNYPQAGMSAAAKASFNAKNQAVYDNSISSIQTSYNPFTALTPEEQKLFGQLPGFAEGGLPPELTGPQIEIFPGIPPEEQVFRLPGFAEGGLPPELTGPQIEIFPGIPP